MDFWFPIIEIPTHDLANINNKVGDHCVKINIPDVCLECNTTFKLSVLGDKNNRSLFGLNCKHYHNWHDIWAKRIIGGGINNVSGGKGIQVIGIINSTIMSDVCSRKPNIDPTKDGMKCSGSCGSWVPMAAPNLIDGTFICYSCRTGF